ncbi:histidine kinase [Paenibacillus sp. LHD-117]|uniref:sensor histidine kinase n=1 Tax=Paenibacillus sp. LHD-117 TaxID=3071412 RepID=UPI0027E1A2B8|nr:histidine kinase [Paenibacillus sp. LHD-117]MDQ6418035.1 histidine kinase [Paenibacillus sp. LHD-117]
MPLRNNLLLRSLRFQLVTGFLIVTIPVVILLFFNNQYAIKVVRNQIAQSNQNTISLYMNQIDMGLEEVDKYLYTIATQETNLNYLKLWERNHHQTYNKAKIQIFKRLSKDIASYKLADMFFVYSDSNQELIKTSMHGYSFEEREAIAGGIIGLLQEKPEYGHHYYDYWSVLQTDSGNFLYHIVKSGTTYVGAIVNVKNVMTPFDLVDLGPRGKAVLTTSEDKPMSDAEFFAENPSLQLSYEKREYTLTGLNNRFLIVGEQSRKGMFNLIALIPNDVILEKLPVLQRIFSVLSFGAVLLVILFLFFLRKVILHPIRNIVSAMRTVSSGFMDSRIAERATSTEMEVMNKTFNNMVTQIQALKISVYEEQLNHQRAELKQLQLQVNPHFFLNSLNIIYNLARVKDFELIKDMSMYLVKYFRYTFRSGMALVELKDEIDHIRNYLNIQELRFPGQLSFRIAIPDNLLHHPIPLLVIQPFVENAIKHAFIMDKPLHIEINVNEQPDSVLCIIVRDNGKGFPAEVLARLLDEQPLVNEQGEHIGIWNVQHRLRLMYTHEQSLLTVTNDPNRGARIEIRLPLGGGNKRSA